MKRFLYILTSLFILCSAVKAHSDVFVFPETAEEGIYSVRYSYFRYDMVVYLHNDSLYLPLTGFLSQSKIYYQYNNQNYTITGFFLSTDSIYRIDLLKRIATLGKREIKFSDSDFLVSEMEVYVVPSLLEKIFELEIVRIDSDLSCYVRSSKDLPILAEHKRQKEYSFINRDGGVNYAPLLYDRERSWINGGILDYRLAARQAADQRNYTFGLNAGMELLGGDFQGFSSGAFNEQTKEFNQDINYRWRYFLGENPYFTQFSAGNLTTSGYRTNTIPSQRILGFQISNESTQLPMYFANHLIEDRIEPGWQVELYVNGQLFDQSVSDPTGYYMFNVPINYGNTNIELKYYGTNGEYIDKRDVVVVPSEFLQPGEIKYNISAGEREFDKIFMGEGRISFGLTNWLSNTMSVERTFNDLVDQTYYNNHLALRLGNNISTSFDVYTERLYKGTVTSYFPNILSTNFSYTHFTGISDLNRTGMLRRIDANIGLPRFLTLPVNFIINGNRIEYERIISNSFNANMFMNMSPFFINLRYYGYLNQYQQNNIFNQSCAADISFNWFKKPKFISYLKNTRVRGFADYNIELKRLNGYGASLEQYIMRWAILNVTWNHNVYSKTNTISAGLTVNMPSIQTQTNTNHIGNTNIYSMGVQGTIGLNSHSGDVYMTNPVNQSAVGFGAASFRFFLDENNNGEFDENEILIPDVSVSIPNGMMERAAKGQPNKAYNLAPYGRFNVIVNSESIRNPLWVPKSTYFSFIADPNSFKSVDIPCYVAGVIEGNVYRNNGKDLSGQSGVKVHVMSIDGSFKDEIPVFSDGSFYKMGLPPGEYRAWVDSAQLALIGARPDKDLFAFTIQQTANGDFVSDINFEVQTKEYLAMLSAGSIVAGMPVKAEETAAQSEEVPEELTAEPEEGLLADRSSTEPKESDGIKPEEEKQVLRIDPNETKTLLFSGAQAVTISNDMRDYLDGLVEYMKNNRSVNVSIVGHTDNSSDAATNMQVSIRRADAVKNYLTSKGIAAGRILTRGQGALYPKESNATPDGRRQNRRVEISILK